MSKVKLTREQAEELEIQKRELKPKDIVQRRILSTYPNSAFTSIELDTLIKALYIGYEIKQEFVVGDWVVTKDGVVAEIIDVCIFHKDSVALYEVDGRHTFETLRHATPEEIAEEKERRWWKSHGREAWELKQGDVVIWTGLSTEVYEITKVNGDEIVFHDKGYELKRTVKSEYKILCFAEDRLDLNE